jgi:hypothetical protein
MNMCRPTKPLVGIKSRGRSAVTNRSRLVQNGDARSAGARRFRDLVAAFSADLGELNESDLAMVKTAATLALKMEQLTADVVNGKPVDADQLIRLAGTSRRALAAVSAKASDRKPGGQNPLQAYLAARAAAQSDDDADNDED